MNKFSSFATNNKNNNIIMTFYSKINNNSEDLYIIIVEHFYINELESKNCKIYDFQNYLEIIF